MARAQPRACTRGPWKVLLLGAAVLAVSSPAGGDRLPAQAASAPPTTPPPSRQMAEGQATVPNILFILLDDMREDGVMNVPEVLPKTKRWLVDGGTTFTQGFVTSPLCCPERATVWSGRLPHNTEVFDNYTGDNLDRDWITPRYLRDAGYRTALVGKFITDWKFRYVPPHFDDYAAFQGGYVDHSFWVKEPGAADHHTEKAPYTTDYIGEKAAEFIGAYEAADDQPWFMQVAPHAPHSNKVEGKAEGCDLEKAYTWREGDGERPIAPWQPTPAVTVEGGPNGRAEKADKAPFLRGKDFTERCGAVTHEGHMRTLFAADDMVEVMMTALEANGELADTLVIFTSDNGFSWNERGATSKGLPYTEHVKVPFLVRWDGVFPAGAVDSRLVSGEDFLPTYLEAAGSTPPQLGHPLDGRSFLPGAPGRDVKYLEFGPVGRPSPTTYQGHLGIPSWASLRSPAWQYVEYYESHDNSTVHYREYYDLVADPWQLDNLLADGDPANDPDVAGLSAEVHRLWTCAGTTGANPCR